MFIKILIASSIFLNLTMIGEGEETMMREEKALILYDFNTKEDREQWMVVNDTVMGGRSQSQMSFNDDGHSIFEGSVSLENNGGFASVRSKTTNFNLKDRQGLAVHIKGDGKKYRLSIRTSGVWSRVNYYYEFETKKGKWMTVSAPFDKFIPQWRGRLVSDAPKLESEKISSVGFLISEKQEGRFSLAIDWIKAVEMEGKKERK